MIKIVKQGETIFRMVCPQCNCIYTYEIGDILTGGTCCPCCNEFNLHSARIKSDTGLVAVDFNTGKIEWWQESIDDSLSSIDRTQLGKE